MQSSKVLSILFCVIIWQLLALVINSELFPSFVDIVKNLSEQILHKDLILQDPNFCKQAMDIHYLEKHLLKQLQGHENDA